MPGESETSTSNTVPRGYPGDNVYSNSNNSTGNNKGSFSMPIVNPKSNTGPSEVIDSYPRKSRIQNPWANVEDMILSEAVRNSSHPLLWNKIAACLPGRSGKQCRERWSEHLDPTFDRSPFSMEEDAIILQGQRQLGNKWKDISSFFGEKLRTPSSVKVRWHFLDRQIKKYGATSDGLPNYPHISYSFSKSVPSAPTHPNSYGVGGRTENMKQQPYQEQQSQTQSQSAHQHQMGQHQMMSFGLYTQMQAQSQLGYQQGLPPFMSSGYPQGSSMYSMVPGGFPGTNTEKESSKGDSNQSQGQSGIAGLQYPLPMHYYNAASMMYPYGQSPTTGAGSGGGVSIATDLSQQFVPTLPVHSEQFGHLPQYYAAGYPSTGFLPPSAANGFTAGGYPHSGSSYMSRGKPVTQQTSSPKSPTLKQPSTTAGVEGSERPDAATVPSSTWQDKSWVPTEEDGVVHVKSEPDSTPGTSYNNSNNKKRTHESVEESQTGSSTEDKVDDEKRRKVDTAVTSA